MSFEYSQMQSNFILVTLTINKRSQVNDLQFRDGEEQNETKKHNEGLQVSNSHALMISHVVLNLKSFSEYNDKVSRLVCGGFWKTKQVEEITI
ncbi:CLUMA_CG007288, isoform A [Clunio marinus]|uniref:CLUMA_CG007288, isoform A n=1 Tax=Clunio marinus TaxID=568069 RepID=A0A1J1I089_9DIPT|nr:CLUMA_CG007288, isoform A [Clunio marinus]